MGTHIGSRLETSAPLVILTRTEKKRKRRGEENEQRGPPAPRERSARGGPTGPEPARKGEPEASRTRGGAK